jgi:HEAT repeat protein
MLVDTLQSKDPLMRFYAASYLGRSDYLRAVQPLAAAAEIENHPWVQNEMARSLVILRKEISFRRERARDSYRFIEPNSERKADSPQPVRP